MTLHELLDEIARILSPKTHELYDYMLHTSEDHGFLRTRYCYSADPVPDHVIQETDTILVAFRREYIEGNPLYEDDETTAVKLQLFYGEGDNEEAALWSYQLGYPDIYTVDLVKETYEKIRL